MSLSDSPRKQTPLAYGKRSNPTQTPVRSPWLWPQTPPPTPHVSTLKLTLSKEVLGTGGFGTIYRGQLGNVACAVKALQHKVVKLGIGAFKMDAAAAEEEAKLHESLMVGPHPSVVKLITFRVEV